jgi:hypothetical protein
MKVAVVVNRSIGNAANNRIGPQSEQRVYRSDFVQMREKTPDQLLAFGHGQLESLGFDFLNAHGLVSGFGQVSIYPKFR